jgi:hypothetical protein
MSGGLLKNSYPLTRRIPISGFNAFIASILLKESLQTRCKSSGFNPTIVGRQKPPLPSEVVFGGKLSATTHTSQPDSRSSMACIYAQVSNAKKHYLLRLSYLRQSNDTSTNYNRSRTTLSLLELMSFE